jgi:hypothetical protein
MLTTRNFITGVFPTPALYPRRVAPVKWDDGGVPGEDQLEIFSHIFIPVFLYPFS